MDFCTPFVPEKVNRKTLNWSPGVANFMLECWKPCFCDWLNKQTKALFLAPEISLTGYFVVLEPSPFYLLPVQSAELYSISCRNPVSCKQLSSLSFLPKSPSVSRSSKIPEGSMGSISCPVSQWGGSIFPAKTGPIGSCHVEHCQLTTMWWISIYWDDFNLWISQHLASLPFTVPHYSWCFSCFPCVANFLSGFTRLSLVSWLFSVTQLFSQATPTTTEIIHFRLS